MLRPLLKTSQEIAFAGRSLAAGKYRLYAVPEADHWVVALNEEAGAFGYSEPDYDKDIMRGQRYRSTIINSNRPFYH